MNKIDFNIKLLEKNKYKVELNEDYLVLNKDNKKYEIEINLKYFKYNDIKYSYHNRIIDVIEEIYVIDSIKETKIYYITKRKLKYSDKNNLYIINFPHFLKLNVNDITEIFDKNYNVYIYIESDNNINITEHFNNLLKNFVLINNKTLLNITIVNYTEDAHSIIYNLTKNNKNIFKKIINLFPYDKKILINDIFLFEYNNYIKTKIYGSFTIYNYNNIINNKNKKYMYFYPYTFHNYQLNYLKGGKTITEQNIIKEFVIDFIEFTNIKHNKQIYNGDIKQIWWYKYYFDKPLCSYGRLLQSTGTCWCNAVLNILFLSEPFNRLIIIEYYKKKRKHIKLKDIVNSNYSLKDLFFALVENILINKQKVYNYHGDIVLELAARIKGISYYNDEFYYKKYQYGVNFGEFYHPYSGLIILFNLFLNSDQWFTPTNYYNINTNDNLNISELNSLKQLQQLEKLNYMDSEKYTEFLKTKIEIPIKTNLSLLSKLSKKIPELDNLKYLKNIDEMILNNDITNLSNKIKYQILNKFTNIKLYTNKQLPIFFVVNVSTYGDSLSISKEIYINDIKFIIINSTITINYKSNSHVISGLICENKSYLYDSTNKVIYDNWINGDFKNYEQFEQHIAKTNNIPYKYFDVIIYMNSQYYNS